MKNSIDIVHRASLSVIAELHVNVTFVHTTSTLFTVISSLNIQQGQSRLTSTMEIRL